MEEASVGRGGLQRGPGASGVHSGGPPRHLRLLPRVPRVGPVHHLEDGGGRGAPHPRPDIYHVQVPLHIR